MKRIITILTAILLIFSFSVCYATEMNFTDVKSTEWYYKNLQELVQKNIASGYPGGTFQPANNLKFEEFIKMLIVATSDEPAEQKEGQEWYQIYIDKALESKYISEEQKSLVGQNIDRKTMAEVLYNVLTEKEKITAYTDEEFQYLADRLTDVNKTDVKTLIINGIGVISGYPDKTFKPTGTLTRAEAVAVISRVINPELRNPIKIVARDANGIIDARDLEKIQIEQTKYQELKEYVKIGRLDNEIVYKVENVIKADVSMFPIKFGPLVITGIEKLPEEKAPYYGSDQIGWMNASGIDAIIIHAYAVEESDDNKGTTNYSPTSLMGALVNNKRDIHMRISTIITTLYGEKVYQKTKEMFPDYALGEYPRVELNQQFTTMILGDKGFELENIDKIILMDTRWSSNCSTATRDVLEIDLKDVKEIE